MVDRQFFTARPTTAVLTREVVTLKNISTAERNDVRWLSIVVRQSNNFRNLKSQPLRLDAEFLFVWFEQRPVIPGVLLKVGGVNDPSRLIPDLHQ